MTTDLLHITRTEYEMKKNEENDKEITIDVLYILQVLLRFSWVIVIVALLAGLVTFVYNSNYVKPKYSSGVMLYVNNKSISVSGDFSISAADLSASQSLIDTYIGILNTRTTMEEVIALAEVDYTPAQLRGMISAEKLTGTELFTVTVTSTDPYEAAFIANCIADVLPHRIEDIVDGSSMRIVDTAVVNLGKVSPNVTRNTMLATVVAALLVCAVIAVIAFFDDTIRSEDYLTDHYEYPILSRIPDLTGGGNSGAYSRSYGAYHSYHEPHN